MGALIGGLMATEERPPVPNGVSPFERIRRTNAAGAEYWSGRDFAQVLGYSDHRNFEQVVERAKAACFNSGQRVEDPFGEIAEMPAESIKKLGSKRRQQRKVLERPSDGMDATDALQGEDGI
jgi:hypothetical protein